MATEDDIDLIEGEKPIRQLPCRSGPGWWEFVKYHVEKMLNLCVIQPAAIPWGSPVVVTPKKCGTYRFYVDYRLLNEITLSYSYPLLRMDECIHSLGDEKYLSTLDWNCIYWKIPLKILKRYKTKFAFNSGTSRFDRIPFGLTNSPVTFQRSLDIFLAAYKWKVCLVYLDNIIVFSKDTEWHLKNF